MRGSEFPSDPNSFPALSTRAPILNKLVRTDEAAAATKIRIGTFTCWDALLDSNVDGQR